MACLCNVSNQRTVFSVANMYRKSYKNQVPSFCHSHSPNKPATDDLKCDMIGPPDSVSNLRPIRFHVPEHETPLEKKFRLKRQEVQQWNQDFWTTHNLKFVKERKEFMAANQPQDGVSPVSADEMSVFYKAFLDKNWRTHLNYNVEWYKKNAHLVLLHIQVKLSQLKRTLSKKA